MKEICHNKFCTACGACINICPKQCIKLEKDDVDTLFPVIDESLCIHCDSCRRACPNNNELEYHNPLKVYAAWSLDEENRRTSASGGITSELYKYTLNKGGFTCGAELTLDKGVNYIPVSNEKDILRVKNSKYVFSHTNDIYQKVRKALLDGCFVFFVGLPCQVAGLKSYLGKLADNDNLLLADIICHGVSNEDYLFQYVQHIERVSKRRAESLSFRDPLYGTGGYVFTLRAKTYPLGKEGLFFRGVASKPFYKQNHYGTNLYYIGYMDALTFRENCYHCKYARKERITDLTFGDFDGLGKEIPFNYPTSQVSLCLVNTPKGERYLAEVADRLFLEERSIDEAVKPQGQLKAPYIAHPKRDVFLEEYRNTHNFVYAARKCLKKELRKNLVANIKLCLFVKPIKMIVTIEQKDKIKTWLKKQKMLWNFIEKHILRH